MDHNEHEDYRQVIHYINIITIVLTAWKRIVLTINLKKPNSS